MEIQFGIHQDLWQDAWIAATSAVRAKKRQIDLNVQQRVQRLISDHSPGTGKALTLRVYGTMIKGFLAHIRKNGEKQTKKTWE